jgi:serine-type D-Ala-D-Ala carboxypeptidase
MSDSTADARHVLHEAIASRVFPAAVVEVGSGASVLWSEALGTLTFAAVSPPASADTPFDLASLTKAVATTTVVMELVRVGALHLDAPVRSFFSDWRGADRHGVTVRHLMEHASGLPARLLDRAPALRREFEYEICKTPLEYPPRTRSVYSDLGFILVGFVAADLRGAPLDTQFSEIWNRMLDGRDSSGDGSTASMGFHLPVEDRRRAAPTMPLADDVRGPRLLVGEVHDDYAAALGGVAGHAGLFGTAPAVGAFARAVLQSARGDRSVAPPLLPELVASFTERTTVRGSSRAIGWDTMLPTSSCGTRMSAHAFGHVGFTGTSLWIDPDRDRYFVLLTNRACGGGTLDDMRRVRREFHDALADL